MAAKMIAAPAAFPLSIDGVALRPGLQLVPFRILRISPFNARTVAPDDSEIAALGDSIHGHTGPGPDGASGVLQNLVTRPEGGSGALYLGVLAGGRRWRAIGRNIGLGRCTPDYPVPVNVTLIDDLAALELSIAENDQREQLSALEQGAAYAQALDLGATIDTLMVRGGRSRQFVRQRLAFHTRLSAKVKWHVAQGLVDLGQAAAFTIGEHDAQDALLPHVLRGAARLRPEAIRAALIGGKIPLGRAIFARAAYRGAVTRDLFGEEAEYAEDRAEFARLQRAAVDARRDELREAGWAWVTIHHGGPFPPDPFERDVAPADGGGAVIHLRDDLSVAIVTGLRRVERNAAIPAGRRPSASGAAPAPASAAANGFSSTRPGAQPSPAPPALIAWAREEKTRRLQSALAEHPEAWLPIVILLLLGCPELGAPHREIRNKLLAARVAEIERYAAGLALDQVATRPELTFHGVAALPSALQSSLLRALVADRVYAWPEETGAQPGDSPLAIALAGAVGAAEPGAFALGTDYLERLDLENLRRVARAAGIADAVAGLDRGAAIDALALADGFDPEWRPPELAFASAAELSRRLCPLAPEGAVPREVS